MRAIVVLTIVALTTCGCGKRDVATPLVQWGVVDESLPPAQRERQVALQRLFKAVQSGTSLRHVKNYEPDLEFQEAENAFFQEGISLRTWDWTGPPQQDRLSVHLEFLLDEAPGDKTVAYDRAYRVNRQGDRFVIQRVQ